MKISHLKNAVAICILSLLCASVLPAAYAQTLIVTAHTTKGTYDISETLTILGTLTLNNQPVPNGIVAIQVEGPDNSTYMYRVCNTSSIPPMSWNITIDHAYTANNVGTPKTSFKRGTHVYFMINCTSHRPLYQPLLIYIAMFSPGNTFYISRHAFGPSDVGPYSNTSARVDYPIPTDAPLGLYTFYVCALSGDPKIGAHAYCPEKSSTFLVTSTSALTEMTNTQLQLGTLSDGDYALQYNLPQRRAMIGIHKVYAVGYYQFGNFISNSQAYAFYVKMLADLNLDYKVDGKDIAIVSRAYNTREGDPLWDARADTNSDRKVDGKDVAFVSKYFGKTLAP